MASEVVFAQRTALCFLLSQHGEETVVLKGDSVSGLADNYMSVLAFGLVPNRPHHDKTRTRTTEKAHHHHATVVS